MTRWTQDSLDRWNLSFDLWVLQDPPGRAGGCYCWKRMSELLCSLWVSLDLTWRWPRDERMDGWMGNVDMPNKWIWNALICWMPLNSSVPEAHWSDPNVTLKVFPKDQSLVRFIFWGRKMIKSIGKQNIFLLHKNYVCIFWLYFWSVNNFISSGCQSTENTDICNLWEWVASGQKAKKGWNHSFR